MKKKIYNFLKNVLPGCIVAGLFTLLGGGVIGGITEICTDVSTAVSMVICFIGTVVLAPLLIDCFVKLEKEGKKKNEKQE